MAKSPTGGEATASSDTTLLGAAGQIEGLFTAAEKRDTKQTSEKPPAEKVVAEVETEESAENVDAEETEERDEPGETAETESEDADDAEEGTDADEDATEGEGKPKTRKLTVKNESGQDEEVEVTDPELEAGYMRQRDYTRKTMQHAETVKKFKAESEAVSAERKQYKDLLGKLEEAVERLASDVEPDWEKLRNEMDPETFTTTFAQYQSNRQKLERVRAEKARVEQQLAAEEHANRQELIARETEALLKALPAWRKPEIAARERTKLIQHARSLGYEDKDIANVSDHRVLVLLHESMRYRELQAKREKAKEQIRKTAENTKPGVSREAEPKKAKLAEARKRHKQLGTVESGAAAIFDMLE